MSSVLTRSSLSLHVNVKQDVEIKHPVGVHVCVGLQNTCSYTAREFVFNLFSETRARGTCRHHGYGIDIGA